MHLCNFVKVSKAEMHITIVQTTFNEFCVFKSCGEFIASNSMNYNHFATALKTVELKLSGHMANYTACDESSVVDSDPMEEEHHTTTKLSGSRDSVHLLGLALCGNLVNGSLHLLVASQVVVLYRL